MNSPRSISLFGATGSIGASTIDLLHAHHEKFDVQVLTAHKNVEALATNAIALKAERAVIADETLYQDLKAALSGSGIEAYAGRQALLEAAQLRVDLSIMAIMGLAGLEPLMHSIENADAVAIANKEPLVAAGALVMAHAQKYGTQLLPLDSEHNAIFQVFEKSNRDAIERLILTASGGPFLDWSSEDMEKASPAQALRHPNWEMGQKISIDSATMMNKGLEVIEAHFLFDMPADKIDVLIHPQSIVHSMVEYTDGSILSQMGASDMRTPIAYALGWPERIKTSGERLDLRATQTTLEFRKPNTDIFKALPLAYEALRSGHAACVALNASNEVAVASFLREEIGFGDIIRCTEYVQTRIKTTALDRIEDIIVFDKNTRRLSQDWIKAL